MADNDIRDLVVPPMGESITEAVVSRWLVAKGEYVGADAPVVELETDKITVELPAPAAGVLAEQIAQEGDTVTVGEVVGKLDPGGEATGDGERADAGGEAKAKDKAKDKAKAKDDAKEKPEAKSEAKAKDRADAEAKSKPERMSAKGESGQERDERAPDAEALSRATPAMRRAMRLGEVRPGQGGDHGPAQGRAMPTTDDPSVREEAVPMSRLRKRIAERLVQAQHETASLTTFNEVDMSAVMALRKEHQDEFVKRHGIKLGFMSFFAKACVSACQLFPGLNAEIRDDHIIYKKHYDFGVAVSTERGLVVPVLRDVDRMGFAQIESGIISLAERARAGKLALDDLTGGSFTITNGGIFGSMLSTPLLNYPQTGILGMHNIVRRPVAIGDKVEIRPIMYIALTYDHRVVDGREAVQFLVAVKERIEKPDRLLFDL